MSQQAPNEQETSSSRPKSRAGISFLLLVLIVLLGGYFRFFSLNWDDYASLHPDERYLTLNLLPQIGGELQFTPDNDHFPSQAVLIASNSAVIASEFDIQVNPAFLVGAVTHDDSDKVAEWWVGDNRVMTYANADSAHQALMRGDVSAIVLPEIDAGRYISTTTISLSIFDSIRVQQIRCDALNPDTNGAGGYFDTYCSPLNPHNAYSGSYAYGTLPLFLAHFSTDIIENIISPDRPLSYQDGVLVWRFFSAFFDVGSIILIFFIGSRMHNRWVGLLAAVLYACAPLAIQKAHFGTVNAITAFFVTLAIWAAVNVQDRGKLYHYVVFGFALGCALAGRINVIPLAGVVVLAGMVNAAPVLDARIAWSERERLLWRNLIGVFLAGITTILVFRVFNPYAFSGPSFFHMIPNARWLADAQGSSFAVSGASDAPPNWQWLGRASFLYPLRDMLFWGMGIAMGVMAWIGFSWSGYRLVRGGQFSLRNILIFAWVFVYFAWIGNLWVMTMRYYLPLYSSLALFAAWALYELYRYSREHQQDNPLTRVLLIGFGIFFSVIPIVQASVSSLTATTIASAVLGFALIVLAIIPKIKFRATALTSFVVAFTILWGLMFTNIYRHQVTRVQAARWASETISGDFSMQIEGAPDGTPLVNIGVFNRSGDSADSPDELIGFASRFEENLPYLIDFTAPASGTVSSVYAPHLADPLDTPENEILYISVARAGTLELLAETTLEVNFTRENHVLGDAYTISFAEPIELIEGEQYTFKVESLAGSITSAGAVILTEGTWDDRITTISYCQLPDGLTSADDPASGLVAVNDCNGSNLARSLSQSYDLIMSYPVDERLKYENIVDGLEVGDYIAITSNRFYDTETRNPMRFPMTTAYYDALFSGELGFELVETFSESYEFGLFSVDDQHLPIYDSPAWFNELEADEAFHVYDHPTVFIFRKTADYDQARTELILGVPLTRIDQIGFGSSQLGAQIAGVVYWTSLEADEATTALHQPADVLDANRAGGTWSDRFDSDSPLNTIQPLGVVVWWIMLIVIGLVTFPLLFTAFPNLADKGYGFSKILGMLLIGWIAWFGANFKLPLWSQGGLVFLLLTLAGFSAYLTYIRREIIVEYLQNHWQRLLIIELISLTMFLIFIGLRLTNPDLWHNAMGGEKPMDFAYFNAVLRTSVFPAYDPWYAGGNINYYYFGYVIVGVPTLLLKIVPSFAYNLILPTLFATTGIGAFSVAFNIVASWTTRQVETLDSEKVTIVRRMGNPYVAGIVALLLTVVLGNLDTPRVLIEEGIARLGGYERPTGLENYLIDQYTEENGIPPQGDELLAIQNRASQGHLPDEIAYEIDIRVDLAQSFFSGLGRALSGDPLPIGSNRWYWAPSRIIDETPGVGGGAITEMPFFTFIYGDLHAHMINMPIMLFALLFIFYEVSAGRRDERSLFAQFLAIFLGALAIGMMKATNTWDWPSFMLLAIVGLGFAWWKRWEHSFDTQIILRSLVFIAPSLIFTAIMSAWLYSSFGVETTDIGFLMRLATYSIVRVLLLIFVISGAGFVLWYLAPLVSDGINRRSIAHMFLYIGGFISLATFVVAPYDAWYASLYSSVALWEGNQTPLWVYWNIHGLFLFLITSLLIWETARWLRATHVRDLRGQGTWLVVGASTVGLLLLISLVLGFMGNHVALIAIPLIVWIAILFFRPEQAVPMQYVLVLAGFALALTLGVEIVVISGDIGRQNTVFKFYIQVWLLFSVVGGVAFAWLIQRADLWRFRIQLIWFVPLMLLVAAASMFPFSAARARTVDRFVQDIPLTLNGMDYMQEATHYLMDYGVVIPFENDYHIIRWLQEEVEGTPVIMEGRSLASEYRYNSRISINTGLPTVLGWNWHQRQQRTLDPLSRIVQQRESNVKYFYESDDITSVVNMIRYYDIEYIIVSDMEIAMYPEGIQKFNRMVELELLSIVYQHGVGLIYQADHDAVDTFLANQAVFNEAIGLDESVLPSYVPMTAIVGHSPDDTVDVNPVLHIIADYEMEYLVLTNPPRVIQFQPEVYDRFLRLEALGILLRLDDSEARRTYMVNQDALQAMMNEDN
ncbi:MAG: hypothetical protein Phog2KO_16920 [Phototrophicaceae bacterium]